MYLVDLDLSSNQIIARDHLQWTSKRGGRKGATTAKRGHGPTMVDTSNTAFKNTDNEPLAALCRSLNNDIRTLTHMAALGPLGSLENHNHNRLALPKPSRPNFRPRHEIALANRSTMALVSTFYTSPLEDHSPNVVTLLERMSFGAHEVVIALLKISRDVFLDCTYLSSCALVPATSLHLTKQYPKNSTAQMSSTRAAEARTGSIPITQRYCSYARLLTMPS
jgi:hypothetical protein